MLNLINKETRQIPGWPVVQGRGVDRVRSTQPPPQGWETLLVISRCLASLSHPSGTLRRSPLCPKLRDTFTIFVHTPVPHYDRRSNASSGCRDALLECLVSPPLRKRIFQNSRRRGELGSKVFANRVAEKWNSRHTDFGYSIISFLSFLESSIFEMIFEIELKNSLESVQDTRDCWKVGTRATRRDAQSNTVSR